MHHTSAQTATGPTLTVRPALPSDKDRLLEWRNHPSTRAVSLERAVIAPDVHARWFADVLERPDRLLLVAVEAGREVGSVRFDEVEPRVWQVSLVVAPPVRGRGVGGRVLAAGLAQLCQRCPQSSVVAEVVPGNVASSRLFARAGFTRGRGRPGVECWWWHPTARGTCSP